MTHPRIARSLGLLVGASVLGFGLGCAEPITSPSFRGDNLIVISIDTLRADRLGMYGYERPTSPHLDALAARGVRFDPAIAESNFTLPTHVSLMTGRPPHRHGVTNRRQALGDAVPTLASVLRSAGYRTFAVTSSGYMRPGHGLERGFEEYHSRKQRLQFALPVALEMLDPLSPDDRFFLFVHTFDVHCPYTANDEYAEQFRTRPDSDRVDVNQRCVDRQLNRRRLRPGQMQYISDLYDAGIRNADADLAEFFAKLEANGRLDRTIVVVLSDHGEEFGEHGSIGHGKRLFVESIRIPLFIVAPGLLPGVVRSGAGLSDVMPTLLEMLEIEHPRPRPALQGESLLSRMLRPESALAREPRALFSQGQGSKSIIKGRLHLIESRRYRSGRLYDYHADPRESSPQAREASPDAAGLRSQIRRHFYQAHPPAPVQASEPSAEEAELLRSLGYAEE